MADGPLTTRPTRLRLPALLLPLLAAILIFASALPAPAAAQSGNLLQNGSFENGYYKQDGVPELAVPNGWRLFYVDNGVFPGIYPGQVAFRPETVLWNIAQAPDNERALFWRDGAYTLKVFKPWAPLYSGLMQTVGGLQAGSNYTLAAYVFVDVVDHYDGASKVPPVNDLEHNDDVRLRLGASSTGAAWRNETAIRYAPWTTAANRTPFHQSTVLLTHTFRATAPQMSVWLEMMSTAAYINNGFFVDAVTLTGGTGAVLSPNPAAQTGAAGTQTAPRPALAGASTYVVRPGDSIAKIAKAVGVPSAVIIDANNLANPRLIRPGQILIIPDPSKFYSVQRGDSLSTIARQFNTSVAVLQQLNNLNGTFIYTGQILVLP